MCSIGKTSRYCCRSDCVTRSCRMGGRDNASPYLELPKRKTCRCFEMPQGLRTFQSKTARKVSLCLALERVVIKLLHDFKYAVIRWTARLVNAFSKMRQPIKVGTVKTTGHIPPVRRKRPEQTPIIGKLNTVKIDNRGPTDPDCYAVGYTWSDCNDIRCYPIMCARNHNLVLQPYDHTGHQVFMQGERPFIERE